uniref:COMM domain-containing protein 3 n=1 Tax=Phallusia mammillata TaxID=59560 RepID=A0A6F9D937_9ASCI|nr:COMM domain-containing protein 3-like [Phallusia mammillata]
MDIVPKSVIEGLRLCGDDKLISGKAFEIIIEHACQTVLGNIAQNNEPDLSKENTNLSVAKQCHGSVTVLMLEAAKHDLQEEQLGMILDDCGLPQKQKEAFAFSYNHYKEDLRDKLSKVGRHAPNLVDVEWRLDYNLKNNRINKVNELQYTISLKQDNGEQVDLVCTRDELQDLVGKLKEASKALERASQI